MALFSPPLGDGPRADETQCSEGASELRLHPNDSFVWYQTREAITEPLEQIGG